MHFIIICSLHCAHVSTFIWSWEDFQRMSYIALLLWALSCIISYITPECLPPHSSALKMAARGFPSRMLAVPWPKLLAALYHLGLALNPSQSMWDKVTLQHNFCVLIFSCRCHFTDVLYSQSMYAVWSYQLALLLNKPLILILFFFLMLLLLHLIQC
jgi:hypothetical protein